MAPSVKAAGALGPDPLQGGGVVPAHQPAPRLQGRPAGEEDRRRGREAGQVGRAAPDGLGQVGGDGESVPGVAHRRGQHLRQREAPSLPQEGRPGVQGPGDADAPVPHLVFPPGHGVRLAVPEGDEHVLPRGPRGDGVVVHVEDLARGAVPEDDHPRPEDADHHRLHHRQGEGGRDRGVDGVAPPGVDLRSRRGGEGVVGGQHEGGAGDPPFAQGEGRPRPRAPAGVAHSLSPALAPAPPAQAPRAM